MRALRVFLVWASQGLQEEHRVSALFCCPKVCEPDGQFPGMEKQDTQLQERRRPMKRSIRWIIPVVLSIFAVSTAMAEVTITTVSKEVGKEGGAYSVNTGGSGEWTATTAADWITISRASGDAGVSCIYMVAANFSTDARTGIIDIAGNTFTVYQTGYDATITPSSATADYSGGSGTVEVSVDAGVSWTAKPNEDWLTVEPVAGISVGTVTYTVSVYTNGTTPRTGTITIAGKTFTVTQTGTDVIITPTEQKMGFDVGTFEVVVAAMPDTAWSVTPKASWISVVDDGYGYGNSTVLVAVGANPSALSRTGTVEIGSKTLTVIQAGTTNISLTITPTEATASPVGAYGNIAVYSTPDAPWLAESRDSWITVSEGETGAGNGNTKYVVTANPLLEDRIGQIIFKQVPVEPEDEAETGRLLYIHDTTDLATGNRTASRSLGSAFDGTFHVTLSGEAIPKLIKNDWSVSLRFKVGELGAVNRLATLFQTHSLYTDAGNKLYVDNRNTGYEVNNQWQRVVVCQEEDGHVRVYAGSDGASFVDEFDASPMHDLTAGPTPIADALMVGYAPGPSEGNMRNGTFADLQFWGRALSAQEALHIVLGQDSREPVPQTIPSTFSSFHFRCSQNGFFDVSSNQTWRSAIDGGLTTSGWSEFPGRAGVRQRAMWSEGQGKLVVGNVNSIFSGSYVVNNGVDLYRSSGHYSYRFDNNYAYAPYPITWAGPINATFSFWIYVDVLPETSVPILERTRVGGQTTDASGQVVNPSANNQSLALKLKSTGQIIVEQNGAETICTGAMIVPRQWTMLTMVGIAGKSITVYLDGEEIGNTPSDLSFGYYPPTDARFWYTYRTDELRGAVIDTVQRLCIGGWVGALDEMTITDGPLTSAQVKALYDETKPVEVFHTVTQGVIEPMVSSEDGVFPASGGDGSVQVTAAASTQWDVTSGAEWISVFGPGTRVGSAKVTYAVLANPSTERRTGTITLAGKTVTVEQEGQWSQLTYDGKVFRETTDSGFISVQVEGDALWTATSDASWLTLLDTNGHGSGEIMFVVDDFNSSVASRTATLTIAGQVIEITQRGYELSIDPAVGELGSNAGAGEIGITAPIDAVWEAIVTADWISLVGGNIGHGSGTLRYTVADNTTGETRMGKIIISGQEYTVTQHANLTLTTKVDGSGTVTGAGDYETNEKVTLTATPDEGFAFTHWSGDAVGVEPQVTITMDMNKTVTAHFIPEDAAQRLAEEKAAQGGFYTREQLKALAMGDTVIEVDGESGTVDLAVQLMETADLVGGKWDGVDVEEGGGSVNVDAEGKVHIRVAPKGNTAFYRLVNANAGEE